MEAQKSEAQPAKCASCNAAGAHLMRCSRCKKVSYCNVDCQRAHFKQHKLSCEPPPVQLQPPEPKQFGIDDFSDMEHLGSGNFSEIFKGTSKLDGKTYAIKQIQKAKVKRLGKEADIFMEKHCLQKLKSWPNAVQIERTFQDEISLYIQMELAEKGELWEQARTFGTISEPLTRYFFYKIVQALQTLHNKFEIVHRDIKPQNILLSSDYQIKFIDFGTAKDLSRPDLKGSGNGLKKRKVFQHFIGTPNYMPPECIHNTASEKVSDIYALAGVFYFLKTGYPPFQGGSEYLIFTKSTNNLVYIPEGVFQKDEETLLLKMLEKDYKIRIDIDGVLAQDYFKNTQFPKSYQQALAMTSKQELYLMSLSKQILPFSKKFGQALEVRQQAFNEQIKPIFNRYFDACPLGLDKAQISCRMSRMLICSYCLLNLEDDNNQSFEELHTKYKQSEEFSFKSA